MLYKNRTKEEIDETIERIASKIVDTRMEAPALLFFESIKPVAFIGFRMGGAFLAPLIPFIGYSIDDFIVPFRDTENVEKVLNLIEQKIVERDNKEKERKKKIKIIKVKKKKPWYWPF